MIMQPPTETQIEDFLDFFFQDHSWYKMRRHYKFYFLFNFHEERFKPFGGLYYITNRYDPPYGFETLRDVHLPDENGELTIPVPDFIWTEFGMAIDGKSIYTCAPDLKQLLVNLVNRYFLE